MFTEDTDTMCLLLSPQMNLVNKPFIISSLFIPHFVTLRLSGFLYWYCFVSSVHCPCYFFFSPTINLHFILFTNSHLVAAIVFNLGTLTRKPPEMCGVFCASFKLNQDLIRALVITEWHMQRAVVLRVSILTSERVHYCVQLGHLFMKTGK